MPEPHDGNSPADLSRSPLRIGITCYPSYGGSGIVGAELGLELAKRGHQVHFVSYAPPMRLADGEVPRLHRAADLARLEVGGNDREG